MFFLLIFFFNQVPERFKHLHEKHKVLYAADVDVASKSYTAGLKRMHSQRMAALLCDVDAALQRVEAPNVTFQGGGSMHGDEHTTHENLSDDSTDDNDDDD